MKNLLTSTAVAAALVAGAAHAQSSEQPMFPEARGETDLHASDFIGMTVYAKEQTGDSDWDWESAEGMQPDWENVGEINDLIISRDGSVNAVLVDIGGFLGLGEQQIAMNMDGIRFVSDTETEEPNDFFLVIPASKAELEEAPAYDSEMSASMGDMERRDRSEEDTAEMDAEGEPMMEETAETGETIEGEMEEETAEVGEAMENAGEEISEETAELGNEIESGAEEVGQETAEMANEVEREVETETVEVTRVEGDTEMEEMEEAEARDVRPMPMGERMEASALETLTTEDLTGARVYDVNGEWIGEVDRLNVDGDGRITTAIVDVGGFLGLGEKPVELELNKLDIMTDNGDLWVSVPMSETELESMPTYEG